MCVMSLKSPKQLLDIKGRENLELEQLVYGSKQKKENSKSLLDEAYAMQEVVESSEITNLLERVRNIAGTVDRIERPVFDQYYKKVDRINKFVEEQQTKLGNASESIESLEASIDNNASQLFEITEKVENIISENLVGTNNRIEDIRLMQQLIHKKLKSIPNEKSRFDPTDILESINELKTSVTADLQKTSIEVHQKVDAIEEIRSYDDDLERLQNLIGTVRSSIKYYDSDVSDLQGNLKDLSESLTETIGKKVKSLNARIDKKAQGVKQEIKKEIKYYDEEIADVEYRIDKIVESVQALPKIKHYDADIKDLNKTIKLLDEKIEAINTQAIEDTVLILEKNFNNMNELQKEFEKRWEVESLEHKEKLDPLLSEKFVTFAQMQNHYRGFIERVQEQLGTIGGGGAVNIIDMDDLDQDVKENPEAYNNNFLQLQYDVTTGITSFTAKPDVVNDIGDLANVDTTGARQGMVLVYVEATGQWTAQPVQYIGVNIDANPDPEIQDYGSYST